MLVREARQQFFLQAGFGDGGNYEDRWVTVKAGPLTVVLPNTASRRRAVQLHDVHHVLTGYETTFAGETEIGAWELGSGLRWHFIGWALDLLAFAAGLFANPRKLFRAFVRGRHSANLFQYRQLPPSVLEEDVDSLRRALHIPEAAPRARLSDVAAFIACAIPALVAGALFLSPIAALMAGFAYLLANL